jgi:hypothetical protein
MCFSASASFLASAGITSVGIITKPQVKHKKDYPLVAIPFIFAIQQAIEGAVWLSLGTASVTCLTYSFVFFSHLFWPAFVPVAFYLQEKDAESKRSLRLFIILGIFTSAYLTYFLFKSGLNFLVNNNHLGYYYYVYGDWLLMLVYFMSTVVPPILSSSKILNYFGWALAVSYFISYVYAAEALFSVWCFFAALLSIIIFGHFWLENKENIQKISRFKKFKYFPRRFK